MKSGFLYVVNNCTNLVFNPIKHGGCNLCRLF